MGKGSRRCERSSVLWQLKSRWTEAAANEQVRGSSWRRETSLSSQCPEWTRERLGTDAGGDVRGVKGKQGKWLHVTIRSHYTQDSLLEVLQSQNYLFPRMAESESFPLWKRPLRETMPVPGREEVRAAGESGGSNQYKQIRGKRGFPGWHLNPIILLSNKVDLKFPDA